MLWQGLYLLGHAPITDAVAGGSTRWLLATAGLLAPVNLFAAGARSFRAKPGRTNQSATFR